MFAAIDSTGYKVVLLIHVVCFLLAMGPAAVFPFLRARWNDDQGLSRALSAAGVDGGRKVWGPALLLLGLTGFALAGMSDEVFKMSKPWLMASVLLWIALNGVVHGMIVRGNKAAAEGDAAGHRLADAGGAISGVLTLIVVFLMVFKPGQ